MSGYAPVPGHAPGSGGLFSPPLPTPGSGSSPGGDHRDSFLLSPRSPNDPPAWSSLMDPSPAYGRTASIVSKQSGFEYWWRFFVYQWWLLEILSLVTSAGLLAFYFYLIATYSGKPVRLWDDVTILGLSLNSVVSFIATIIRGTMLLPVASALGQLKWHYFKTKYRRAVTLDEIDRASRGSVGSIRLLFSGNILSFSAIGALIIISSVFMSSMVQSSVRTVESATTEPPKEPMLSTLPVTNTYSLWDGNRVNEGGDDTISELWAPWGFISAIYSAWYYKSTFADVPLGRLPLACQGGNCTWTNVATLGLEYSCLNAPVESSGNDFYYSEQAGINNTRDVNGTAMSTYISIQANPQFPPKTGLDTNVALLTHVAAIGNPDYSSHNWEAIECSIYWVVRRAANASYGVDENYIYYLDEPWIDTYTTPDGSYRPEENVNLTFTPPWGDTCNFTNFYGNSSDEACKFTVFWKSHFGIQNFLSDFFDDWLLLYTAEDGSFQWKEDGSETSMMFLYANTESENGYSFPDVFRSYVEIVCLYANNSIRITNAVLNGVEEFAYVYGDVTYEEMYFDERQIFAAFPAALLLLSTIFFAGTAWYTRKEPIWKNSQLPLIYHGLSTNDQPVVELKTLADMKDVGEKQVVKLLDLNDGRGSRLRGAEESIPLAAHRQSTVYSSQTSVHSRYSVVDQAGYVPPTKPHGW